MAIHFYKNGFPANNTRNYIRYDHLLRIPGIDLRRMGDRPPYKFLLFLSHDWDIKGIEFVETKDGIPLIPDISRLSMVSEVYSRSKFIVSDNPVSDFLRDPWRRSESTRTAFIIAHYRNIGDVRIPVATTRVIRPITDNDLFLEAVDYVLSKYTLSEKNAIPEKNLIVKVMMELRIPFLPSTISYMLQNWEVINSASVKEEELLLLRCARQEWSHMVVIKFSTKNSKSNSSYIKNLNMIASRKVYGKLVESGILELIRSIVYKNTAKIFLHMNNNSINCSEGVILFTIDPGWKTVNPLMSWVSIIMRKLGIPKYRIISSLKPITPIGYMISQTPSSDNEYAYLFAIIPTRVGVIEPIKAMFRNMRYYMAPRS